MSVVGTLEADNISLRSAGGVVAVSSTTQRVRAGKGCIQVKKSVVTCAGTKFVKILARAGNDRIRNNDNGIRTEILAGDGADRVSGGPGRDILRGGDGDDILIGGRGTDSINGDAGTDSCAGEFERNCER